MRKKSIIVLMASLLFPAIITEAQIEVNTNGNVGIGSVGIDNSYTLTTNSCKLEGDVFFSNYSMPAMLIENDGYVAKRLRPTYNNYCKIGYTNYAFNKMYSYSFYNPSDARQKENIVAIQNSLELVLQFQAVNYDLKKEYVFVDGLDYSPEYASKLEEERINKIGYLAQDVEKILPQLVEHDDSTDTYAVNYVGLIPILSEAIKEQQVIIEKLQAEIDGLKSSNLKSMSLTEIEDEHLSEYSILYQNSPNPFSENTIIAYSIQDNAQKAMICIYDLNGTQLKCYHLHNTGEGEHIINRNELNPGMYIYSLFVDESLVDSKQMILTD